MRSLNSIRNISKAEIKHSGRYPSVRPVGIKNIKDNTQKAEVLENLPPNILQVKKLQNGPPIKSSRENGKMKPTVKLG